MTTKDIVERAQRDQHKHEAYEAQLKEQRKHEAYEAQLKEQHKPRRTRDIPPNALGYRPLELVSLLGVGKTKIFAMLQSGELASIKLGRTRIIPADAVKALLEREAA